MEAFGGEGHRADSAATLAAACRSVPPSDIQGLAPEASASDSASPHPIQATAVQHELRTNRPTQLMQYLPHTQPVK